MSGGSYDYLYSRVYDLAERIESSIDPRSHREPIVDPRVWSKEKKAWITGDEALNVIHAAEAERKWFVEVLRLASKAAHDIEWVDSGDYGPGDEVEAIQAIRTFLQQTAETVK